MLTLALDVATRSMGVALLRGPDILAEVYLNSGRHHAETLLPAIEYLCMQTGVSMGDLDLLACTNGPGAFTGVRIGVSTLKGFGLALQKPLVGVSTLAALAMNAMPSPFPVCTLLDARKEQIYAGLYRQGAEMFPEPLQPEGLFGVEDYLEHLHGSIFFLGDGAVRYQTEIRRRMQDRAVLALPGQHLIRASSVAWLAQWQYLRGDVTDPDTLLPRYFRSSEAEQRRAAGGVEGREATG